MLSKRLYSREPGKTPKISGLRMLSGCCYKDASRHTENLTAGDYWDKDYDESIHTFHSVLVAVKARVTPLKTGLTIPGQRSQDWFYAAGCRTG